MSEFATVDAETWRQRVIEELKGQDFERALVHRALGGLTIEPLYDATPEAWSPPGVSPYVRGGTSEPATPRSLPVFAQPDVTVAAEHLTLARRRGADGGFFRLAPSARGRDVSGPGLPLHEPPAVATLLGHEAEGTWVLDALLTAPSLNDVLPTTLGEVWLGGDPMGATLRDGALPEARAEGERALAALMSKLDGSSRRAGMLSTLPLHLAGADVVLELAYLCAAFVHRLRTADAAGVAPEVVARQTALQLAVDSDVFMGMAQLRAARALFAELAGACGVDDVPPVVHAVSSPRSLSRHDPWVNMLRVTTQTFAAINAGADLVSPACFDEAVGQPDALGYRVARNTMNVLREESHLGWVVDPAGGSHYVEALTKSLVESAYARFQTIETAGGLAAYVDAGKLHQAVEAAWTERRKQIARRKLPRTGVSEFALVDEPELERPAWPDEPPADGALPRHRDDEPFEALRAHAMPGVFLANLGPLSEHKARATFAQSFFAAGGMTAIDGDGTADLGPDDAAAVVREAFAGAHVAVACLCGHDDRYPSHAEAAARALKAAGATRVYFAGRPPAQMEGTLREAGVDDFIFLGADVEAALKPLMGGAA